MDNHIVWHIIYCHIIFIDYILHYYISYFNKHMEYQKQQGKERWDQQVEVTRGEESYPGASRNTAVDGLHGRWNILAQVLCMVPQSEWGICTTGTLFLNMYQPTSILKQGYSFWGEQFAWKESIRSIWHSRHSPDCPAQSGAPKNCGCWCLYSDFYPSNICYPLVN